jgi:hypothetical protein
MIAVCAARALNERTGGRAAFGAANATIRAHDVYAAKNFSVRSRKANVMWQRATRRPIHGNNRARRSTTSAFARLNR